MISLLFQKSEQILGNRILYHVMILYLIITGLRDDGDVIFLILKPTTVIAHDKVKIRKFNLKSIRVQGALWLDIMWKYCIRLPGS